MSCLFLPFSLSFFGSGHFVSQKYNSGYTHLFLLNFASAIIIETSSFCLRETNVKNALIFSGAFPPPVSILSENGVFEQKTF